jgi:nitroreductase
MTDRLERAPARKIPASGDPYTEVESVILQRRSVRAYKSTQVPAYLVQRVLECGRYAPSAGNNQSWKFVVLRDPALMQEMTAYCRTWAQRLSKVNDATFPGAYVSKPAAKVSNFLMTRVATSLMHPTGLMGLSELAEGKLDLWHGAPTVILVLSDKRGTGDPRLDAGIAGTNLVLAAHGMGLGTCWVSFAMFLERSRKYKQLLGVEYPYRIATSIALGFPLGQPDGFVSREAHESLWIEKGGERKMVY